MSEPRTCPECHAEIPLDAPQGVCPACALKAGLGSAAHTVTGPGSGGAVPLAVEELNNRLPGLQILELIGRGGMGAVYKARQKALDRTVAVKVLRSDLPEQAREAFGARFSREARTLARLTHQHIVSVYDFGQQDDLYYLVMELVDGVSLRQIIEAGGIEPREALAIIPAICQALQYAHDAGVVHRDIKPENVLMDRQGVVKIADFGLAKLVGSTTEPRLTGAEQVMGTPHYMAPEQIERPSQVDHRADIYALGVVLYELLTGELPIGRFAPPSRKVQIDVRLDDVVLRTLEKEPDLRYQRASELQTDVENLSQGGTVSASTAREAKSAGYELRSKTTLWGWPLVHVAFGAGGTRVARGVIAVGNMAVGGVAIGGVALGWFALGGISIGVIGAGGIALGLLALGGIATGAIAMGDVSQGLFALGTRVSHSFFQIDTPLRESLALVGRIGGYALVLALIAALALWLKEKNAPSRQRGH